MISDKKTILVVDDSEIIRKTILNFLKGADVEVIFSINGLDGIQKTALHKPDLIILDLLMPDLDGIKMLKVIKLLDGINKIPVIVISSNTEKNNVIAAIKAGANKVITKPLVKEVLVKSINEIFGFKLIRTQKENEYYSELEKIQLKKELLKTFIDDFIETEKNIQNFVQQKKREDLKIIIHNLRGAGSTMGHPKITEMSAEIEYKLQFSDADWSFINLKCEQLSNYIMCISKEVD